MNEISKTKLGKCNLTQWPCVLPFQWHFTNMISVLESLNRPVYKSEQQVL